MTSPLYVDTIHLNVGVGDCSIVCKLRRGEGEEPKPVLVTAVLIDGGRAKAGNVILQCLTEQIPRLYDLTEMGNEVKLTAVVITHWDDDYYGGIISLIQCR
jgi:glyoxylase-like metal-dependent hydrolase (beta-lactamase superfamily II)